jgi:hypothetical protein
MTLGIQIFLGIIGALTLLIGGVGVANIMYAVVKERTREIGVKMALGARADGSSDRSCSRGSSTRWWAACSGSSSRPLVTADELHPDRGQQVMEFLGSRRSPGRSAS